MMKSNKNIEIVGNSQNRIAAGTTITGDIVSEAGFRIDGNIKGTLKTNAKVVIGKDGKIDGTLECSSADIEGTFTGTLKIDGLLSLKSTAVIEGEVTTVKLSVEPGATFNASCSMGKSVKSMENEKQEKSA
jgi:cytoskeletal protein CcmA (bactofilin family)